MLFRPSKWNVDLGLDSFTIKRCHGNVILQTEINFFEWHCISHVLREQCVNVVCDLYLTVLYIA